MGCRLSTTEASHILLTGILHTLAYMSILKCDWQLQHAKNYLFSNNNNYMCDVLNVISNTAITLCAPCLPQV